MTREEIIRNLEYTMEKHKNDTVSTFDTNISLMCKDILDYLEQEPCEDAISRQAVIDDLEKSHMTSGVRNQATWNECIDSMMRTVRNIPSVTPKQKSGKWIDKFGGVYRCSCCREIIEIDTEIDHPNGITFKYCPNCGAKMEDVTDINVGNISENPTGSTCSEKPNNWISVSERLPEDSELVLFSTKTDRVFEGRYFADNTDRQWYAFRDEDFAWNNVVTAWMPLPEPYLSENPTGSRGRSEEE